MSKSAKDFIKGANISKPIDKDDVIYPWDNPVVSKKLKINFTVRLPEPLHLKLKYLGDKGKGMHAICFKAIEDMVENEIKKLMSVKD